MLRPGSASAPLAVALASLVLGCGSPPAPAASPGAAGQGAGAPDRTSPATAAGGAPEPAAPPTTVAAGSAAEDVRVVAVEAPPFGHATPRRVKGTTVEGRELLKLTKVSEARNAITDDDAWFRDNGVTLPVLGGSLPAVAGPRPSSVAAAFRGEPFLMAIQSSGTSLALYGSPADGARYVVALPGGGAPGFALDFAAFRRAPGTADDARLVVQGVRWAELWKDVLFVSSYHRTYAASSGGKNAFLTAVDPASGAVRWQSEPLVANATNFLLWDGFIVTGYGFTDEPDHMIVVDQATGATLARTFVKSGPSFLARKGDQLLVRTYDTNYVFDVD